MVDKVYLVGYKRRGDNRNRNNRDRDNWAVFMEKPSMQQAEHEALRQAEKGDGHDYAVFEMVKVFTAAVVVQEAVLVDAVAIPADADQVAPAIFDLEPEDD